MRKIKFRAWDDKENKMLDWEYLREYCDIDFLFGGAYEREKGHPYPYPIAMQYTGLKDKNGIEIYEGDIVRCYGGAYLNGVYEYDYVTEVRDIRDLNGIIHSEFVEILGNKYENPELLGV